MTTRIYGFTALTGGGTGALDKYPEAGMPALATDDYAIGHVSGLFYLYRFDGASAEAESSPDIIAPDSGSGRWILKSLSLNHNDLMNIDGGNVSPEEYYHLASALYNVINSATAQSIIANPTGGATSVTNVTVAEQTLVGRITGGNVDDLSVAQVKTLLGVISDTAYASSWDGVTDVAPSKNAVYDRLETAASETVRSMVELATNTETLAGTDTGRVVTPSNLTAKILGTVSQSGGVPTGAIIESGSNANGSYRKFADGTAICMMTVSVPNSENSGNGLQASLPITLTSDPKVTVSNSGVVSGSAGATYIIETNCGTTSYTIKSHMLYSSPLSLVADETRDHTICVIGRWF